MGPFDQTPPPQINTSNKAGFIGGALNIGSGILGSAMGLIQQKRANKFNVDMWNRQNEYNSPVEQMRRLGKAGLNPNLIYGTGSSGASGTAQNAPNFEKLAESAYRPVDIPSTLSSMQSFTDWDIKKATADNIRARTATETESMLLRKAEIATKMLTNEKLGTERPYWSEMAKTSLQASQQNVRKTEADTKYTINQDERAQVSNDMSLKEAAERILTMRVGQKLTQQQTTNARYEMQVKKLDAELARKDIRPQDPIWWSMVERLITNIQEQLNQKPDKDTPWYRRLF